MPKNLGEHPFPDLSATYPRMVTHQEWSSIRRKCTEVKSTPILSLELKTWVHPFPDPMGPFPDPVDHKPDDGHPPTQGWSLTR